MVTIKEGEMEMVIDCVAMLLYSLTEMLREQFATHQTAHILEIKDPV